MAHFDEFCHYFSDLGYHIICLSETWLKWDSWRNGKRCGLYIVQVWQGGTIWRCWFLPAELIQSERIGSQLLANIARWIVMVEINLGGVSKLLLTIVYSSSNCGYLQEFENPFLDFQTKYIHSIILGDFNADMLVHTYDSVQLKNFIASSNMYFVPLII